MYSAWFAALISGIVVAAAVVIESAIQLTGSSTPDPLPMAIIVGGSVIAALVAGIIVAVAVRGGLLMARCRLLAARFAGIIAVLNVAVLGILGTTPVETHAIKLEMPSGQSSPIETPITFWLIVVMAILVPLMVAYVIGRVAELNR